MALHGTLRDFSIVEILQLIGQQGKTGVLRLASRREEVHVLFADGCVVSADTGRPTRERLGGLLVRAGLLSRDDLARALSAQRRTLRRLGDLLVELELASKADVKEVARLQTTETLYRLFDWKDGTYHFEPDSVEWDPELVSPLRAESILMEGMRRLDEWPIVRKRIGSAQVAFERLVPPEELPAPSPADAEEGGLGPRERRVYALVEPGRTVAAIADLARLGEFDASKALVTLLDRGLVAACPAERRRRSAGATDGAEGSTGALRALLGAVAATVAIALAIAGLALLATARREALGAVRDPAPERFVARSQLSRLSAALEVYRAERGEYPQSLDALVEASLATRADLRWPWGEDYHYRRDADGGYVLLPPFE
jgi:hypothetical protein